MKQIIGVIGSQKTILAVEVGKTTVYVRSNIEPHTEIFSEDSIFAGWKYDEIQYDKDEFLAMCGEKVLMLEKENAVLNGCTEDLQKQLNQCKK